MPPWKADPVQPAFIGEQRLTDEEINTIGRWVAGGTSRGREVAPVHTIDEGTPWQLGRPDLVIEAPAAYTLRADGADVFHLFVIPVPLDQRRYVRGLEFEPTSRAVHHANILIDRTHDSRAFSETNTVNQAEGFVPRSAQYPEGQILGWVPGQPDPLLPTELAWALGPGTDLVVQVHLQPTGRLEQVQPRVALYFSESAPTRTPTLLRLGRQDIHIAAGDSHYVSSDGFVLPVDAAVLALKPHAHYRARSFDVRATLPNGSVRNLIRIRDWDIRWQQVYRYSEPVVLPKGSRLTMDTTYDNSSSNIRNPAVPPLDVKWGPQATDEMGDCWVQLLSVRPEDVGVLNRDVGQKMAAMDLVGYDQLIATSPRQATLREDAGLLALQLGRGADAVRHFEGALRVGAESAAARFNLGLALALTGRIDEAIREYRRAIEIHDSAAGRDSLATALAARGDRERAFAEYERALTLEPRNARVRNNLGNLLMETGRLDAAMAQFRAALDSDPLLPDAHYNVGLLLEHSGLLTSALSEFREAERLSPQSVLPKVGIAWILATAPDATIRKPTEAIQRAKQLGSLGAVPPGSLDVLAAAYASAGRFADARSTIQQALLSRGGTDPALLHRENLYAVHRAYEESAGVPPDVLHKADRP